MDAPEPGTGRRGRDLDTLFLVLVVFLPALLYLPSLGFYSDDWGFLAAMGEHPNGSLWQYILWMIPAADLRPGHAVYAAVTYFAFGLAPLGYHVVNHLIVLLGLIVLGFGYLIFVTNDQFYFSAAGITNRITQISSLGVAIALAGLFGLLGTLATRPMAQRAVLSALVGLYGAAGVLLIGTIGNFWQEAYRRELAIVDGIRSAVPTMAPGSALLLDGECAYHGPAIVFESSWDPRGVVRLFYQDPSLRADIVSARFDVYEHAVTTWLEKPHEFFEYRYADGLVVYNHRHGIVVPIRDIGEMERYLERYNRTRDNGCPFGWPGNGVTILPRPLQGG